MEPDKTITNTFTKPETLVFIFAEGDIPQLKKTLAHLTTYNKQYHTSLKLIRYTSKKELADIKKSDIKKNRNLRKALALSLFHKFSLENDFKKSDLNNLLVRTKAAENNWLDEIIKKETKNHSFWQCNNFVGKKAFPDYCSELQKTLDDLNHKDTL